MKNRMLLYTNGAICLIIVLGFIATSIVGSSANMILLKKEIENVSQLTSEAIYLKINNLLDQPINVSITMANDTFLKKYLALEETDENPDYATELKDYLHAYKEKYDYDSMFLISTKTNAYYHYDNKNKRMRLDNPEDAWFYSFLKGERDYALNVDKDAINNNGITVFVNCKIKDDSGAVLGVVGVGLKTEVVQALLKDYEEEFYVKAYLIDKFGALQLSSEKTELANLNIFDQSPFMELKNKITEQNSEKETQWYSDGKIEGYYITQYVPNLNWYLVVNKDMAALNSELMLQNYKKLAIIAVIILLVLIIITQVMKNYNKIITKLIMNDPLTGIYNRTSYEESLRQFNANLSPNTVIAIGVFDLNDLKKVNDLLGHHQGDLYIKNAANIISESFFTDRLFRIGGDEFAMIFENSTASIIEKQYEGMLKKIRAFEEEEKKKIDIAFGYAFYDGKSDASLNSVFLRADQAMYLNKEQMKKAGLKQ